MKPSSALAVFASLLTAPAAAVEYTVSTCAELASVDDTLATGLTIDSSTFACDEYTRFRVRNTMTLKATGTAVDFSNFSLKVLGELTVEPDVTFTGVVQQVQHIHFRCCCCSEQTTFPLRTRFTVFSGKIGCPFVKLQKAGMRRNICIAITPMAAEKNSDNTRLPSTCALFSCRVVVHKSVEHAYPKRLGNVVENAFEIAANCRSHQRNGQASLTPRRSNVYAYIVAIAGLSLPSHHNTAAAVPPS